MVALKYQYKPQNKIKNYSEIYDYRYEYILGPSDTLNINLTDTDDLDGTYEIDENGMIDLPFIGKIKLDELTLSETQNILLQIIQNSHSLDMDSSKYVN